MTGLLNMLSLHSLRIENSTPKVNTTGIPSDITMQEQLIELQTQLTFQEQTISELNDVLTNQQQQIDLLVLQMKVLREYVEDDKDFNNEVDSEERPPHY